MNDELYGMLEDCKRVRAEAYPDFDDIKTLADTLVKVIGYIDMIQERLAVPQ